MLIVLWRQSSHPITAPLLITGAVNETQELLMHHLHEHTLPCYHESLHYVLKHLRNNDLQIATRIFLREGYLHEHSLFYYLSYNC